MRRRTASSRSCSMCGTKRRSLMRRSRADPALTRRQIVETASRLFRGQGIAAVSVADIMSALGLTVGGFYLGLPGVSRRRPHGHAFEDSKYVGFTRYELVGYFSSPV